MIRLAILNITGVLLWTLITTKFAAGQYNILCNGKRFNIEESSIVGMERGGEWVVRTGFILDHDGGDDNWIATYSSKGEAEYELIQMTDWGRD